MRIAFVGPTYPLKSKPASVQQTVNMYPVPIEPGNERTDWVFKDMPGLVEAATFGPTDTFLFLLHFTESAGAEGVSEFAGGTTAVDQTGATWASVDGEDSGTTASPAPKFGAFAFGASSGASVVWLRDAAQADPAPDTVAIGTNTALTIDAWVYRGPGASGGFQVRVGAAYPDLFVLNLDEFDTQAQMWSAGVFLNDPAGPIAESQWTHVRMTYTGDVLRLFVGGVLVVSSASTPGLLAAIDPIETMQFTIENFYGAGFLCDEVTAFLGTTASTANFTPPTAPWPNP